MRKRGRPTKDPGGKKRVKRQPWVSAYTASVMDKEAEYQKKPIGHIVDQWLKARAGQNTKAAEQITEKTKIEYDEDPI